MLQVESGFEPDISVLCNIFDLLRTEVIGLFLWPFHPLRIILAITQPPALATKIGRILLKEVGEQPNLRRKSVDISRDDIMKL